MKDAIKYLEDLGYRYELKSNANPTSNAPIIELKNITRGELNEIKNRFLTVVFKLNQNGD